ncbi:immunity protein Tsi6 family protein [Microbulbifer sp. SAOS-129_SWC]|uniref:immunity protein Tsi6 family protein n=1 Tax=Microbulbifer sp. SAOS-129_SWC TaxID=3145235 RepID=UPI00321782D2
MDNIKIVNDAITLTESRLRDIPDFGIYKSVLRQLSYLLLVLEGGDDNGMLDKVIVGHYAVHEFEESDPELASLLKKCQNIAFKLNQSGC